MVESGSLTVYPSAYLASESTTWLTPSNTDKPVGKGANNTSGYARFKFSSIYPLTAVYGFDVSAIPANAEIDSVSCTAGIASTSGMNATLRLYSGSTSIVSKTEYIISGKIKKIMVSGGAWTRDMLSDIRLVINQTSSTGTTQYSIKFYGADLTVTYTYQSEKFMLKLGGAYNDVARTFKKANGIWVEQTELANVVDQTKRLVNGGEYVVELPEGYTRLSAFQATGSETFDTGVAPSSDLQVEISVTPNANGLAENAIFGSAWSISGFFLMFYQNKIRFHSKGVAVDVSDFNTTGRNTIKCTQTKLTVNGTEYAMTGTGSDSAQNIRLFGVTDSAGITVKNGVLSCHDVKFRHGGVINMYWIPCTNASGVAGFYDVSKNVFHAPGSEPVSLISFTMGDTSGVYITYQAEAGMTWAEWCASGYNTAGFYVSGSYVYSSGGKQVRVTGSASNLLASSVISSGGNYYYK